MARAKQKYKNGHDLMKARRAELGLSLRNLGDVTGIDPTHIMHIEKGNKKPSMEIGFKLLEALSIPVIDYMKACGYKDSKGIQGCKPRQRRP